MLGYPNFKYISNFDKTVKLWNFLPASYLMNFRKNDTPLHMISWKYIFVPCYFRSPMCPCFYRLPRGNYESNILKWWSHYSNFKNKLVYIRMFLIGNEVIVTLGIYWLLLKIPCYTKLCNMQWLPVGKSSGWNNRKKTRVIFKKLKYQVSFREKNIRKFFLFLKQKSF